jgi:hypothetical protein
MRRKQHSERDLTISRVVGDDRQSLPIDRPACVQDPVLRSHAFFIHIKACSHIQLRGPTI